MPSQRLKCCPCFSLLQWMTAREGKCSCRCNCDGLQLLHLSLSASCRILWCTAPQAFLTSKLGISRLSRLCADQKSPDKTYTVRPRLPTPRECFQRVQMAPWRPCDACFDVQPTFQLPYLNTLLNDRPNMVIYRVSKAAVDFNNVQIWDVSSYIEFVSLLNFGEP